MLIFEALKVELTLICCIAVVVVQIMLGIIIFDFIASKLRNYRVNKIKRKWENRYEK